MAIDPMCGMTVEEKKTPFRSEYLGTKVYFCCAGCKTAFDRDPAAHMLPHETG
ncbi:MAG: YHS domain-containing protein [Nitrososphaerales archaeon]|jgi:YHS domain-containing protein